MTFSHSYMFSNKIVVVVTVVVTVVVVVIIIIIPFLNIALFS